MGPKTPKPQLYGNKDNFILLKFKLII